jgi:sugar phosphate permease
LVALALGAITLVAFPHLLDTGNTEAHSLATEEHGPTFALPARGIFALGVLALCVMMGEGAMADWSAVYLRNNVGTKESLAAAGYTTFAMAMAAGRFGGDYVQARLGAVILARLGAILAASGLLLALVSGHAAATLIGFAFVGAGFATLAPMIFSAAGNSPGIAPGTALAMVTTVGYFGLLLGPPSALRSWNHRVDKLNHGGACACFGASNG